MSLGGEPPKFVKDASGVRRISPEWKAWKQAHTASGGTHASVAPTMLNEATALPIVSSVAEQQRHLQGTKTSDSVEASVEMIQDEDIAASVGMNSGNIMQHLNMIFAKYEVPMGLLNKLMGLSDFQYAECIIDDSGSMNQNTDSNGPNGRPMTRWQEVHQRLVQMFEILAYVPKPPFYIRFLNRQQVIECKHGEGEPPEQFLQRVLGSLAQAWQQMPAGTTPARERIHESLQRCQGQSMIRYFFGDGQPNGGAQAARDITQMLITRANPAQNPFTFCSCTNEDAAVEWMKECEEAAPYCAEFDDFMDESREVLADQGRAFPYSMGMHLISQLVAAFNPNDLDAMDESVPFTKQTLDNLQGYQCSPEEYMYYFREFCAAQSAKPVESALDKLKKDYLPQWQAHLGHFQAAPLAKDIPIVQQYQAQLRDMKARGM